MAVYSAADTISAVAGVDADFTCVLDLVHLSRQTLGDRHLETELLGLFDRQAANALARLDGPGGERPAAADVAHMLKGSARAIGAFGVAAAAADLEHALRNGLSRAEPLRALSVSVKQARDTVAVLLG